MPRRPFCRCLFLALTAVGLLATTHNRTAAGQGAAPKSAETAPAALPPLAGYIPAENLVLLAEFTGIDHHADAWKKTAASKILTQTTTGKMLEEILPQLVDRNLGASPAPKPTGDDITAILKYAARKGVLFALNKAPNAPKGDGTIVFRSAFQPEIRPVFARLLASLNRPTAKMSKVAKPGGRSLVVIADPVAKTSLAWWIEKKEDLVVTDNPDKVIEAIDGKCPRAADLPIRKELAQVEDGFEPVGLAFAEKPLFAAAASQPAGNPLAGVERLDYRWGLQDDALMAIVRVSAPSPRSGTLALLDQPTFTTKGVPALPSGVHDFSVFSLDLAKTFDALRVQLKEKNPDLDEKIASAETTFKEKTRLRFRDDILAELGPKIAVFQKPKQSKSPKAEAGKDSAANKPEDAAPKADPAAGANLLAALGAVGGLNVQVPKAAILIEAKNPKAFGKRLDELIIVANRELKSVALPGAPAADTKGSGEGRTRKTGRAGKGFEFQASSQQPKIYVLSMPAAISAMTSAKLTVAMGKSHFVVGTALDAVKDALAAEAKPAPKKPPEELAKILERVPSGLVVLSVEDQRDSLPEALASFPAAIQTYLANTQAQAQAALLAAQAQAGAQPAAPAAAPTVAPVPEIKVDPSHVPKAEDLTDLLFPATLAVAVDGKGIRVVTRSAFPDFAGSLTFSNRLAPFMNRLKPSPGVAPGAAAPASAGTSTSPAGGTVAPR